MDIAIREVMTQTPHTIGREQTLAIARELMRAFDVRHLPVLEGGKLVGVLSERDVNLLETFRDVDPHKTRVEEAMSPVPYSVTGGTSLARVAHEMAEHRYGSTVVVDDHGKVVGVFTTTDALRWIDRTLHGRGSAPR